MKARSAALTTKPFPTGAAVAAGSAPSMAMTTTRADTAAKFRVPLPDRLVDGLPSRLLCFMTAPRAGVIAAFRPCGGPHRGGLDPPAGVGHCGRAAGDGM